MSSDFLSEGGDDLDDDPTAYALWATPADIRKAIRQAFERSSTESEKRTDMHRLAIEAIQTLKEQAKIQRQTSISVDMNRGVRVVATSRYV